VEARKRQAGRQGRAAGCGGGAWCMRACMQPACSICCQIAAAAWWRVARCLASCPHRRNARCFVGSSPRTACWLLAWLSSK
jgi:hypothetical protein